MLVKWLTLIGWSDEGWLVNWLFGLQPPNDSISAYPLIALGGCSNPVSLCCIIPTLMFEISNRTKCQSFSLVLRVDTVLHTGMFMIAVL